ncbi:hypothetical protein CN918_30305 [Priestia megaterium]|nr:hypothetical protein CN918_30305 [Priestia megaterium]
MTTMAINQEEIRPSYHSVIRFVQRVYRLHSKKKAKRFLTKKGNFYRARRDLIRMFKKAQYLCYGYYGQHDKAHFYLLGTFRFIVRGNKIITLLNPYERR